MGSVDLVSAGNTISTIRRRALNCGISFRVKNGIESVINYMTAFKWINIAIINKTL